MIDYAKSRNPDFQDVSNSEAILGIFNRVNSEIYEELIDIDPNRYRSIYDITVVTGTSEYDLPADFWRIKGTQQGVKKIEQGQITESLYEREYGSPYRGYYITNDKVVLTPQPKASETLTLVYTPNIAEMTSTTDEITLPDAYKYQDLYMWLVCIYYAELIGDESRIDLYTARAQQLLDRLRQNYEHKKSNVIRIKRRWA